ncbi:MAG TPA: APC family permease [Gemmatimonadaceae bacterium]|nr:APC family permease [Gemmatimonadaceae bacterium]
MTQQAQGELALARRLTLRDMVLLNLVAVISLRWLATSAATGPSALVLWVLAALFFFIPMGFAVSALSVRHPEAGGLYAWTKRAYGDRHGFICGWCYWTNNLLYYPNLLLATAAIFTYAFGRGGTGLENDLGFVIPTTLLMLWFATLINVVGVGTGRWLQNIGAICMFLPGVALIVLGIIEVTTRGSANEFSVATMTPNLRDFSAVNLWASIAFAFAGLELAPTMAAEVRDPERTLKRAVLIAAPLCLVVYGLGTASVLWIVPHKDVNIVTGILQAIDVGASSLGVAFGWISAVAAALVVIGNLGSIGAWLSGPARVALTIGIDRYFPRAFGRVHPKYRTPYVAFFVQASVGTIFLLLGVLGRGTTVQSVYLILLDTMLLLYFIPFLYLFASYIRIELPHAAGLKKLRIVATGISGFALTLFAMIVACVPPTGTPSIVAFEAKVVGGALFFVVAGTTLYAWRHRAIAVAA